MNRNRWIMAVALLVLLVGCSQSPSQQSVAGQDPAATSASTPEPIVNPVSASEAEAPAAQDRRGGSPDPEMAAACEMACAARVAYREADLALQPAAHPGDLTRCPVSGVVFHVRKSSARYISGDETWYTCCGTCVGKLKDDPARFIGS